MPLTEVIPQLRDLSRGEKLRLIQVIADELAREDLHLLPPGEYPVWSPHDSYEAAAQIQQLLDAGKTQS